MLQPGYLVLAQGGAWLPIDRGLLAILVCPADRAALREDREQLVCASCGRRYPVRDNIPVLLVEEAEPRSAEGGI
jgi:uncharacterized protein YbaR (Trm112 family)